MEMRPAFQFFYGQNGIAKNIRAPGSYQVINQLGKIQVHYAEKAYFCQNNYNNSLKNNLKCGQLLINVDFSKNYANQEQQEIQYV